jgi:hypothetical protein
LGRKEWRRRTSETRRNGDCADGFLSANTRNGDPALICDKRSRIGNAANGCKTAERRCKSSEGSREHGEQIARAVRQIGHPKYHRLKGNF